MKTFAIKLKHDKGTIKIKTVARNKENAVYKIIQAEHCPVNAIKEIKELKTVC